MFFRLLSYALFLDRLAKHFPIKPRSPHPAEIILARFDQILLESILGKPSPQSSETRPSPRNPEK